MAGFRRQVLNHCCENSLNCCYQLMMMGILKLFCKARSSDTCCLCFIALSLASHRGCGKTGFKASDKVQLLCFRCRDSYAGTDIDITRAPFSSRDSRIQRYPQTKVDRTWILCRKTQIQPRSQKSTCFLADTNPTVLARASGSGCSRCET